ncbi:TPA: Arc family DNA-binding protein [Clostridioides difficile]|nr:Arc family DNA-binding protein [Clostridioides difficile]MCW0600407.1 Arc family DNA-binding protein [Clostridioides difficile]MDU8845107.1 Arc family DNA-binding protein [Clostridioides difficile]HBF2809086.1 Arc family DNA-binding protein [Clostridioides difficile]HBF3759539.1 Arc family DNA-binding protein [Clostridioides difficile]HBF6246616.1 Arc family DNA-binding protein [Clostridioides difficile]
MQREQTTIRLPKELKEKLEKQASKKGRSFNSILLSILQEFIQNPNI